MLFERVRKPLKYKRLFICMSAAHLPLWYWPKCHECAAYSSRSMIQNATWWMWLPGFLGSFYILFMFIAAPKIGAGSTLLWVFLGQMYFALILSQTGLFGLTVKTIDIYKIIGLALVTIGGIVMIYGETKAGGQ